MPEHTKPPVQVLQKMSLFQGLALPSLQSLAEIASFVVFEDGRLILQEGDEDKPVYFIQEGAVRIFRTNYEGRELTLSYLEKGAAFNLPPVFSGSRRAPASAMAVGGVKAVRFDPQRFHRLVSQDAEIALAILKDLSDKLEHFTSLAHDLSLRSVRARLARFLLVQAQGTSVGEVWTQEKIAARIGTVREVVSRMMRAFIREGLIRTERQNIILLDPDRLEAEAESN